MTDTPSFQDLLGQFSEEIFVGRAEQLQLFDKWLSVAPPPFLILAISGQGGVGKTTLLEHFRRRTEVAHALDAYVDEEQLMPLSVMARIAEQLLRQQHPCSTFDERYRKYRELKEQIEGDPKAPKGFLDFAVRSAARIGLRSLRRVPVAGDIADVFLAQDAENQIVEETSAFAEYVRQRFTNRDERVLLLETDRELTGHLLKDLSRIAEAKQIFLIFDTYEQTSPTLDGWLRALLAGEYGQFSGRIRFVIAGRYPLGQNWTRFRRAVHQLEIQPFTETEARQYLQDAGIADADIQTQFLELSEKLPVLLALLVNAPGGTQQGVATSAVDRFLQGLSSSQREASLLSAMPRRFDLDTLAVLMNEDDARLTFEWLSRAHFVREIEDGWRFHDVVRTMLHAYLRHRSQAEYVRRHDQLANYYLKAITSRGLDVHKPGSDLIARKMSNEFYYHRLSADQTRGLAEFIEIALSDLEESWLGASASFEESLNQKISILRHVGNETDTPEMCNWASALHIIGIQDATPTSSDAEFVGSLSRRSQLSDRAKSTLLAVLAVMYSELGQLDSAMGILSEAKSLYENNPFVDFSHGYLLLQRGEYDHAVVQFTTFENKYGVNVNGANYIKHINVYYWRGRAYLAAKEYTAAVADFTKASELQPDNGDNYYWQGRTHLEAKEYAAAVADFTKASELQPDDGYNYHWRGRTHLEAKEYAAAVADFTKASELQPDDGYNYRWRGRTHLEAKEYAAAVADFTKASELQPDDGYNYRWRGQTHLEAKEYAAAVADFTKASELQPDDGYNYRWRGQTHLEAKEYAAAVADFTKASELQPDDGYNYRWRGLTHREAKEYAAAVADFTKASELQPDNGDNYFWRGLTHFEAKEYTAAVADFTKASEL